MSGTGYGDKTYWDKRYEEQKDKYDWYLGYDQFKEQLLPYLNVGPHTPAAAAPSTAAPATSDAKDATAATTTATTTDAKTADGKRHRSTVKVLIVGCGNSELSENMFDDGFSDCTSIDYSEVVIEKMQAQFRATKPNLKFEVMDVRDMKYKDETFDCIIDKGTLDAILCGSDSAKNAGQFLSEAQRVLKKGGFFFVITYGQPQSRLNYLEKSSQCSCCTCGPCCCCCGCCATSSCYWLLRALCYNRCFEYHPVCWKRYKWKVSYQNLGKTRYMYVMENVDPGRTGGTPYDD